MAWSDVDPGAGRRSGLASLLAGVVVGYVTTPAAWLVCVSLWLAYAWARAAQESKYGRYTEGAAGERGWLQYMPASWAAVGVGPLGASPYQEGQAFVRLVVRDAEWVDLLVLSLPIFGWRRLTSIWRSGGNAFDALATEDLETRGRQVYTVLMIPAYLGTVPRFGLAAVALASLAPGFAASRWVLTRWRQMRKRWKF